MKHAEKVTFGGSGLERAAHLRGDGAALGAARGRSDARCCLLWRGKPLLVRQNEGRAGDHLALLPLDHKVLGGAAPLFFIGIGEGGAPVFAHDVSAWEPEVYDAAALGQFLDPTEQRHPDLPEDHLFAELRRVMTRLSPRDAEIAATAKALMAWHDSHGFCANCGTASEITEAGWQRGCPACGRQHFPRTDPVVIMLITWNDSVLMGRSPGWPAGMFSLLAGFVEPGETLEAAVRREVFEEAGVRVGDVGYLASQPWPFPASLMIGCQGTALSEQIEIDPNEIEHAMWVSREEMAEAFAGHHPVLKPARSGAIAHFLIENWLNDTLD